MKKINFVVLIVSAAAMTPCFARAQQQINITLKAATDLPALYSQEAKLDVLGVTTRQSLNEVEKKLKNSGFYMNEASSSNTFREGSIVVTSQKFTYSVGGRTDDLHSKMQLWFSSPATGGIALELIYNVDYKGIESTEPSYSETSSALLAKYGSAQTRQSGKDADVYQWLFDKQGKFAQCPGCAIEAIDPSDILLRLRNRPPVFAFKVVTYKSATFENRLSSLQISIVDEFAIQADAEAVNDQMRAAVVANAPATPPVKF